MALDPSALTGRDGHVLPHDLKYDTELLLHHQFGTTKVYFIEYTGEVAHPRHRGAVVRYALAKEGFLADCTDTAVAGELTLA